MTTADPQQLETRIGHTFQDRGLLAKALTHSSTGAAQNYERLEFLGDRVLGLVIAELLFTKFPEEAEGDLAKRLASLAQGTVLAQVARTIDLGDYVNFSEAERQAGGADNDNILADVMESLIGALYLDAGLGICRTMIEKLWDDVFYTMKAPPQHPKTALQEWAQAQGLPLPAYTIAGQSGPDHAPLFEIRLEVEGYAPVTAEGRSRQIAEKEAAQLFLKTLKKKA